jgi:hypothetical protein
MIRHVAVAVAHPATATAIVSLVVAAVILFIASLVAAEGDDLLAPALGATALVGSALSGAGRRST